MQSRLVKGTLGRVFLEATTATLQRRWFTVGIISGVLLSSLLGGVLSSAASDKPSDILPLSEVKPGMKGYGLTVFSGTTPEKFDVEILSVLRNFRPHQDLILIKTPNHPRLDAAKTVAGMSGSPIYLEGKMIGAYAYGWQFGAEPIAGVTPIESMLDELARPIPKGLFGSPFEPESQSVRISADHNRYTANVDTQYDLSSHSHQLANRNQSSATSFANIAAATTPIMMGGIGSNTLQLASNLLSPLGLDVVQAGGASGSKADPTAPTQYVDGGAIGVELVRGDIAATGLGTVTRVSGNKLLAFGHPMLNGGIANFPTSIGKIHWILATQNRSFKIGQSVRSLGALVNDRQAAIVVDTNVKASQFPMRFEVTGVEGAPHPIWNVEIAHDPFMTPAFVAMVLGNAVETTTAERRNMTWRATSTVHLKKYGLLTVYDFGSGNGGPPAAEDFARGRLIRALGSLLSNIWEPVQIERIDTKMDVRFRREVSILTGVRTLESEVEAGAPIRIQLELTPYQGQVQYRTIELKAPIELAGREIEIDIAPGYEVEFPAATPHGISSLITALTKQTYDPESVVTSIKLKETGAAYKALVASRLPSSAVDMMRSSSTSDYPETFTAQIQTTTKLNQFIVGRDTARIKIRPILR